MDLKAALIELCEEVKRLVDERIAKYGVNERAKGKNTLVGSNLHESIKVYPTENGIEFQIAEYWIYVASGRKAGWKGHPPKPPGIIHGITKWVRDKNITIGDMTQNQVIWYVLEQLEVRDIKARPFMIPDKEGDLTKMIPELNDYMDKWFEDLFNGIMEDVDKFFNVKK